MKKSIHSQSEAATRKVALELASSIKAGKQRNRALVIALKGELGAGKTVFVQALAKALGARGRVSSPTFLIVKSYPLPGGKTFHHIDCYRLSSSKELSDLGFLDILKDKGSIVAVEWADKVKALLPKDTVWFTFLHEGELEREIRFA